MKIDKLVIERSKWGRGNPPGKLLDQNSKMCCLGFLAKACGAQDEDILGVPSPFCSLNIAWPESLLIKYRNDVDEISDSSICRQLQADNDNDSIDDWERERRLKNLFNAIGIEVVFVD